MLRAYKFRLLPTKEQQELLNNQLDCVRFIYNWSLDKKKTHYEENKEDPDPKKRNLKATDLMRIMTKFKKDHVKNNQYPFLDKCAAQPLQIIHQYINIDWH